mgnify:CR=1 FL=1
MAVLTYMYASYTTYTCISGRRIHVAVLIKFLQPSSFKPNINFYISGIYTIGIPPPTYEVKGIPPMYYEEAKGEKISSREVGEERKEAGNGNTQM